MEWEFISHLTPLMGINQDKCLYERIFCRKIPVNCFYVIKFFRGERDYAAVYRHLF